MRDVFERTFAKGDHRLAVRIGHDRDGKRSQFTVRERVAPDSPAVGQSIPLRSHPPQHVFALYDPIRTVLRSMCGLLVAAWTKLIMSLEPFRHYPSELGRMESGALHQLAYHSPRRGTQSCVANMDSASEQDQKGLKQGSRSILESIV